MKTNPKNIKIWFLITLVSLTISACNLLTTTGLQIEDRLPTQGLELPPIQIASETAQILQGESLTTPTVISTATLAPSPTATAHPMSIPYLREQSYPGSAITVENELEPGINYRRFYASYLSDGLKIYGLLTIPNGEPPETGWPAIVFNHGYIPPDVYRTTERYITYVDNLARSQYVVFRIDYRGHDRSEGEAKGAYGDSGYLSDVLNAFRSLQLDPRVDSEKVGMWGHSMGGYLTLRAMVINPEIRVGVIWAGVVASYPDMISLWRAPSEQVTPTPPTFARRWRQAWIEEFGSPADNPAFWQSVSSNSFLMDISGPVQLHHGDADETVPLVFSELLSQQMQAVNKPVELYVYPGDNHNISNYFSLAMTRTIAFFDQSLKTE